MVISSAITTNINNSDFWCNFWTNLGYLLFLHLVTLVNTLQESCLGYYAAYVREKNVLKSSCIRTSPFWMQQLRSVIGNLKLSEVGTL